MENTKPEISGDTVNINLKSVSNSDSIPPRHAMVIDFSPSEQLTGDPARVITMGILISISDLSAIDRVGGHTQSPVSPFALKKWTGKSDAYKLSLIEHLQGLVASESIACGYFHAEEHAIVQVGKAYVEELAGPELKDKIGPIDLNNKGRQRVSISVADIGDRSTRVEIKLLLDEIYIMCWIVETIVNLLDVLSDLAKKEIGLVVFTDRLPLDANQNPTKLHFLALIMQYFCGNRVSMMTHEHGVDNARDLLADNIAGLAAQSFHHPNSSVATALNRCSHPIFTLKRKLVTEKTAERDPESQTY